MIVFYRAPGRSKWVECRADGGMRVAAWGSRTRPRWVAALALAGLAGACGDDSVSGSGDGGPTRTRSDAGRTDASGPVSGDAGTSDHRPPADGRLHGDPDSPARDAVDLWFAEAPHAVDLNPMLGDTPTSSSRALAVLAEGATVGEVNGAFDRAGVRIVGAVPPAILFVDVPEPDFAALRTAVVSLQGAPAIAGAGEDLALVSETVPPDAPGWSEWTWGTPAANAAVPSGPNWALEQVRAPAAWDVLRAHAGADCSPPSTPIGIIDMGIASHRDLARAAWTPDPPDDHGEKHALAVAGVVAAGSLDADDDGIEGAHPWAMAIGRTMREPTWGELARQVFGNALAGSSTAMFEALEQLVGDNPSMRILNHSQGWPWTAGVASDAIDRYNPDTRTRPDLDAVIDAHALAAVEHVRHVVQDLGRDFVLFQAAGNGRRRTPGITARYSSPFTAAAALSGLAYDHVVIVESSKQTSRAWSLALGDASHLGGDVSAPGTEVGLLDTGNGYKVSSGTSYASPLAAGIAGLVATGEPDIGGAALAALMRDTRVTVVAGVRASRGVDALNAVLSLDGDARCGPWRQALVDVDDGSAHGLRLWAFDPEGKRTQDPADGGADGAVDMADFRAWRTAYHYYVSDGDPNLPGNHPKLDLNHNAKRWTPDGDPERYARQDFNGDGMLDLEATRPLLGDDHTDLSVLQACFEEGSEGWNATDLSDLVDSHDLLLRLEWVAPEIEAHRLARNLSGTLDAIEVRWVGSALSGADGLNRRIATPLPQELWFTVPNDGGHVEIAAIIGGEERCSDFDVELLGGAAVGPSAQIPASVHVGCFPADQVCCDDGCKDLRTDVDHCGTCGNACGPGQVCELGLCKTPGSCAGRECGGVCYEFPSVAAQVCEGCASPCGYGRNCCGTAGGMATDWQCCTAAGENCCAGDATQCCKSYEDLCLGVKTDTRTDDANCGFCANPCNGGTHCCGGTCVDFNNEFYSCGSCGNTCAPSKMCCNGSCVSRVDDPNCGSCGNDCDGSMGLACCFGVCSMGGCGSACPSGCPAGQTCDTAANQCLDLENDQYNCGIIGKDCGLDELCIAGLCTTYADNEDPANCGFTGNACAEPYPDCCDGQCLNTDTAYGHCGGCDVPVPNDGTACCGGAPTDLMTDAQHCGTCGNACAVGKTCCYGSCVDPTADVYACGGCGKHCMLERPERPASDFGSADLWPYAIPLCCESQCVDPRYDHENCGGCGIACGTKEECCLGACVDPKKSPRHCGECHNHCGKNRACCGGICRDILYDDDNCGGCGTECPATGICIDGGCVCEAQN